MPSRRQGEPVAQSDLVGAELDRLVGGHLAFEIEIDIRASCRSGSRRQSRTRPQAARPGSRHSRATRPPASLGLVGDRHLVAALAERAAGFEPGGAGADDQDMGVPCFGRMRSGCQPRRHSSPIDGFWVQRIGVMV